MEKKYNCKLCCYSTDLKANFDIHLKSIKHINNSKINDEEVLECDYCGETFAHKSSLSRHKNSRCKKIGKKSKSSKKIKKQARIIEGDINDENNLELLAKQNAELVKQLSVMKDKIMNNEIEALKEKVKILEKDKDYFKSALTTAGKVIDKMSNLEWVKYTYSDAPPLKMLSDNDIMSVFKSTETKNIKYYKETDRDEHECFRDQMIYYHRNKSLPEFFCGILTKKYKNEKNPADQPMWTCDVPRGNYAVKKDFADESDNDKENSDSENSDSESSSDSEDEKPIKNTKGKIAKKKTDCKWISDKKGVIVEKKTIKPLLKYAKDVLQEYASDVTKISEKDIMRRGETLEIISQIKSGSIKDKIKKILAGEFQLARS